MTKILFLLLLTIGSGCRVPSSGSEEPPTTSPPATTSPAPIDDRPVVRTPQTRNPEPGTRNPARELNVRLESPRKGDVIRENPIIVTGQARTFENNVVMRLLDSRGQKMVETFTTAVGEMGTFSAFSKEIFLTRDPGPRLTVEAFEHSAKDGSVQHLNSVTVPVELRLRATKLHFSKECAETVAVNRDLPVSKSLARLMVEALIAGPTGTEKAAGANHVFPQGSAVQSVLLRDGVVTVDLNERLENVGGSCRALGIRSSIEKTLGELPTVRDVRITVRGSEKTALQP